MKNLIILFMTILLTGCILDDAPKVKYAKCINECYCSSDGKKCQNGNQDACNKETECLISCNKSFEESK